MSKMRKRKYILSAVDRNDYHRKDQRLRMVQGVSRLADCWPLGNPLRSLRHGKGKDQNHHEIHGHSHLSELRQSFLNRLKNFLQWIGDNSGCHQIPERSFFIGSWQFPLCARCTGAFLGQTAALFLLPLRLLISIPCAIIFLGVMGTDWLIQETGIKKSTNPRRLVTGFLGGFGLYSLYIHMGKKLLMWLKKQSSL